MSIESEERREDHQKWRTEMEAQLNLNTKMTRQNTAITEDTKSKVDEVYDILMTAKGAFKFFGVITSVARWCAKVIAVVAKWVTAIAIAIGAVWALIYQFTHGGMPPK